ncbi:uncharacterized protein PADG_03803 [Paracoccidioides brasiliensis Pb18]|uniref:Uncharacterized protein n=1 Tax=Paracoccidioides brasiliensis (strain Pb18) TaxID=502780 RepID=C1G967_PARBD|nr:uncharacterized protein PADG_03803 [Paracoccidioides brasiliensis Pb18]EEH47719.2 hypothetical protein PADG_03803 [Paracoccidioides brasiliensis Pb18]
MGHTQLVSTSPCSRFMPRSSSDLLPRGGEAANSERQPNIRRKRWARTSRSRASIAKPMNRLDWINDIEGTVGEQ